MRIYRWIPAGLMLLGGAAFAQQDPPEDRLREGTEEVGEEVSVGAREARRAVSGTPSPLMMGELSDGREVNNTLTTSATGIFLGQGVNATYQRPFWEKISGLAGANFSRTRAADGAVTAFGALVGLDWFIIGQNNEGLRLGPRVDVGFGFESIGENSNFVSVGLAGELGYNWIASNGITAGVGAGVHGETGGITRTESFGGGWYPYGTLNVGYSW